MENSKPKNSKQSSNFTINGHGNSTKNLSYNKQRLNVAPNGGALGGLGLGGNAMELKPGIPKPTPTGSFAERNAFRSNNVGGGSGQSNPGGGQSIPTTNMSAPNNSNSNVPPGVSHSIQPQSTNNALANLQKKHGLVSNSKHSTKF